MTALSGHKRQIQRALILQCSQQIGRGVYVGPSSTLLFLPRSLSRLRLLKPCIAASKGELVHANWQCHILSIAAVCSIPLHMRISAVLTFSAPIQHACNGPLPTRLCHCQAHSV